MLSLSPAKLLVILVVALIVLGPDKLPQMARQLGAFWHDIRQWRGRIESEVRGTFPNLPPTHEVARVVRSPLAFLDKLADEHEAALEADGEDESDDEDDADETVGSPATTTADGVAGGVSTNGSGLGASRGEMARTGTAGATAPANSAQPGEDGAVAGWRATTNGASAPVEKSGVLPDDPSMN